MPELLRQKTLFLPHYFDSNEIIKPILGTFEIENLTHEKYCCFNF